MLKLLRLSPSRIKDLLLLFSLLISLYLLFFHSQTPLPLAVPDAPRSPTRRHHLMFSIASSSNSFLRRSSYIRLWYTPHDTRIVAFLNQPLSSLVGPDLPLVVVFGDTRSFPYTFKSGLRSAIRVTRVVKEAIDRNETRIRWSVFGDDDTIFVIDNLVKVLSKYDHDKWYYIGSSSKSYKQNVKYSFGTAYGGGILQQIVCYDHFNPSTVSVAWGYATQVYEGNQLLPYLLSLSETFSSWKRGSRVKANFMFNTREYPRDSCERPLLFYLKSVASDNDVVWSNYTRHPDGKCLRSDAIKNLKEIKVVSQKLELDIEQERKFITTTDLGPFV
ncbi:hypothetical protein GQ457_03G005800 [Hibiscus cannabinus]